MDEAGIKDKHSTQDQSLVKNLLGNSQAAMMAAIEIYNKPMFPYREECTVILLLNAWELLLKAILTKNAKTIYYPEKPNQPTRTLSWKDAFHKSKAHFPTTVASPPIERNLDFLASYRDKAIHFYNVEDIATVVYALSQTSILNYRDLLLGLFSIDIADQMNLRILPLATRPPIDVISFIKGSPQYDGRSEAGQFITELSRTSDELTQANADTGRLLTVFNVKLESVKKIGDADVVVAVDNDPTKDHVHTIERPVDPNQSHPLRQKDIVGEIHKILGQRFSSYTFQAIIWKYQIKQQRQYSWIAEEGILNKYSRDLIVFIRNLTKSDIEMSLKEYGDYRRARRKEKDSGK